jgi:hypothetical protein
VRYDPKTSAGFEFFRKPSCICVRLAKDSSYDILGAHFKKAIQLRATFMYARISRLRTHQKNIDRCEGLLKTELTDAERQFLEKRLSEERLAIAMLQFIRPSASKNYDAPGEALE